MNGENRFSRASEKAMNVVDFELARNLAARMLAGAGDACLVLYRDLDVEPIQIIEHSADAQGILHITCLAKDVPNRDFCEVRVDVLLKAPDFRAEISTASTHMLGVCSWGAEEEGVITARIELKGVHVHQYARPYSMSVADALACVEQLTEVSLDRLEAAEVVSSFGERDLAMFADATSLDILPGRVGSVSPLGGCVHAGRYFFDRAFLVDVCEVGLTLLRTSKRMQHAVFIPFAHPVRSFSQLSAQLAHMVERSQVRGMSSRQRS